MNRLKTCFESLAAKNEAAFVPFQVIGDPDLSTSFAITQSLIKGGADILEFGFAFSDPPADGPVIQAADGRALAAGVTTDKAFSYLARVRESTELPIALLIYYNLILSAGVESFYRRAREAGVDAILVADVPIEEAQPVLEAAHQYEIAPIFIVSELTSEARLEKILEHAQGYLYLVARIGITGQKKNVNDGIRGVLSTLQAKTSIPVLVGFGLATPEHVATVVKAGAQGAISGSAIVGRIAQHHDQPETMLFELESFCRKMKAATTAPSNS